MLIANIVCIVDIFLILMHTSCMVVDDIYKLLGESVAARRKALSLTQSDLAKLVGLSRASIANIEVGRQKMLVHQLYAVATALQLENAGQLLPMAQRLEHGPSNVRVHIGVPESSGSPAMTSNVTARQRAEIENLVSNARPTRAGSKAGKS
ncbi:MAG: XRE family transcriptional regulator [Planctomycetaceae bacterium]|nr:XRE family transcriptional regulator [Planctomycetaceae bacterium]